MPFQEPTVKDPTEKSKRKGVFDRLFDRDEEQATPVTLQTKAVVEEPFCDEDDPVDPNGCEHCKMGPNGNKKCISWLKKSVAKGPYHCVQFDAQSEIELGSHTFFPISPNSYIIIYDETNKPVYRLKPFPIPTDSNQYVE